MTPVNNSLPFRLNVGAALKAAASAYSQTVRNEPGLLAYWRVGDTQDADASRERSYVALGIVPHLDEDPLGDASVEFFFQVISDEQLDYEPCLISHQISHGEQTRFAFHVTRDLTALRFFNGTTNTLIFPPDGPIKVGQWYHFLATQQNAIGITGDEPHEGYGGNVNRVIREDDATSIHMTHLSSSNVDMVLSAQEENACATASWTGLRDLYEAFLRDGELEYVEWG